ncbi:MAG: flagellar hook-basal body complex protein FliE [Opitutaceae bacterium]|nr:flagellar hook-basal body complex protein FliE [Opitutaceae bacterium]
MNPIGTVSPLNAGAIARPDAPLPRIALPTATPGTAPTQGFSQMLEGVVGMVEAKTSDAQAMTRKVLLGDSDQLHQSVIAMQEASVAFTMMVEVRNKLVESYQELMRMQV